VSRPGSFLASAEALRRHRQLRSQKRNPYAKSFMDSIFRWLAAKFLGAEQVAAEAGDSMKLRPTKPEPQQSLPFGPVVEDAPLC
jgi:hypothetical protein